MMIMMIVMMTAMFKEGKVLLFASITVLAITTQSFLG